MFSVVREVETGRSAGVTIIAAMDGSARLAALGTTTDLSVQMNLDREVVGALLDAATDAALGNGKRDGHASHDGKLRPGPSPDPSQSAAIHAK